MIKGKNLSIIPTYFTHDEEQNLFADARNGNIKRIRRIISKHIHYDYNFRDPRGTPFIFYIVDLSDITCLNLIFKTNIRIDVYDADGTTLLFNPIKYGKEHIVKTVVEYKNLTGIPIYLFTDHDKNIPLYNAIILQSRECFDVLLGSAVSCTLLNKNGYNGMHLAVLTRDIYYVKKVHEFDSKSNSISSHGEYPLHIACRLSLYDISAFLIDLGIGINEHEFVLGRSPLHNACQIGNVEIIKKLIGAGAIKDTQMNSGSTPLHLCIFYKQIYAFSALMEGTLPNTNLYNAYLEIPLHIALYMDYNDSHEYISALIRHSNLNIPNVDGVTCMHLLCSTNLWKKYADVLVIKKMDATALSKKRKRPIDYVNKDDASEFLKLLVGSYHNILIRKKKTWREEWMMKCDIDGEECDRKIRELIIKSIDDTTRKCEFRTYPIHENSVKCISMELDKEVAGYQLQGYAFDALCNWIYAKKKFHNLGIPYKKMTIDDNFGCSASGKITMDNDCPLSKQLYEYSLIWIPPILHVNPKVRDLIVDHLNDSKIEYFVLNIYMKLSRGGHANAIMYTRKNNEIERYDPNGAGTDKQLDAKLKFYFKKIIPDATYLAPEDYMTHVGPQSVEGSEMKQDYIGDPGGFCLSWIGWYVDMRLTYPQISRKKITNTLIYQSNNSLATFREIIRNYSIKIGKIRDEILKLAGMSMNKLYNDDYSDIEQSKFIDALNNYIEKL